MKRTNKLLLASAAVLALGLAMPSSAQAFDSTDWVWTVNANKTIEENVNVNVDISPTGMATVENLQQNVGDVTSTATLSNFTNNPPNANEGDVVSIDETITVTSNFDKPIGVGESVGSTSGETNSSETSPFIATYEGGTMGEQANGYTVINDINFTGDLELSSLEGINDAADLPKVENAATSVANNMSLDGSVAMNISNGQFNYGDFTGSDGDLQTGTIGENQDAFIAAFESSDNANHALANTSSLAAALGAITQGEVQADALIDGSANEDGIAIQNASVENAATAVGNNFSTNLEAISGSDAFLVADSTQFNYANTTATATVDGVAVDNYTGFGDAGFGNALDDVSVQTPVISNTATAVGNNSSITVSSPDLGL